MPKAILPSQSAIDPTPATFGFLSGGATLALAENVAGVGSMALCDGKMALGINVSGNHVQAMPYGGTVTAYARILHQGHKLHVWHIDVKNDEGELISSVQVTNYIVHSQKKELYKES